ncbi:heme-binding protein [Sphingopyxis sp.]|uniref:GlcG/HbpS family heme-binding protein n=1 Tax=Sphingopyxis sp. TaxID=1908224 RepID=UPI001D29B47E|nr:heme-binding protein [Sphingopyxis sp.]MBW8294932.1 heme-binding protein [Sphingopyxis sp.]
MKILWTAVMLAATPASAQMLDANMADVIVKGCAAHASAKGQSHAIAVVDTGGHLVAAWRMDGNGHGAMEFSLQKARAVAAWGFPTSGMEEAVKGTPGFAEAAYVVTVAGGIPVFSADGRTRIGGVGASGEAPADDAACAAAGIAAAGLKSERAR